MVPTVIYACFVLHKFCESHGCSLGEEAIKAQMRGNQIEEDINKTFLTPFILAQMVKLLWLETPLPHLLVKFSPTSETTKVRCILHIANPIPFFSSILILEAAKSCGYSLDFLLSHVVLLHITIYVCEDVFSLYRVKPLTRRFYLHDVKNFV